MPAQTLQLPSEERIKEVLKMGVFNKEAADLLGCGVTKVKDLRVKFGIPSNFNNRPETTKAAKKSKKNSRMGIEEFLGKGRTIFEIRTKFDMTEKEVMDYLESISGEKEVFWTRNNWQEKIVVVLPKPVKVKLKPKVWTFAQQPDGEPYLWIQFPDSIKWEKIKVVPLADAHFGAYAHDKEKFMEYVNWIAETDNVFCFINGDLLEAAYGDSCRGVAIYDQEISPKKQANEMEVILSRIAHKVLWAIPGNHEDRARTRDHDPLEVLCRHLEIPYYDEPIFVDVMWQGYVFDWYCQHGNTSSQTKGGKLNAASRPQKFQEHTMFTVMAHVHDSMVNTNIRMCRDRVNFKIKFKKQYVIICSSFLKYFGTYASRFALEPGEIGAITCEVYANGKYYAHT